MKRVFGRDFKLVRLLNWMISKLLIQRLMDREKTPEDFIIEGQEDKWIFVEEPPIDNEPLCNLILEEKDKSNPL